MSVKIQGTEEKKCLFWLREKNILLTLKKGVLKYDTGLFFQSSPWRAVICSRSWVSSAWIYSSQGTHTPQPGSELLAWQVLHPEQNNTLYRLILKQVRDGGR